MASYVSPKRKSVRDTIDVYICSRHCATQPLWPEWDVGKKHCVDVQAERVARIVLDSWAASTQTRCLSLHPLVPRQRAEGWIATGSMSWASPVLLFALGRAGVVPANLRDCCVPTLNLQQSSQILVAPAAGKKSFQATSSLTRRNPTLIPASASSSLLPSSNIFVCPERRLLPHNSSLSQRTYSSPLLHSARYTPPSLASPHKQNFPSISLDHSFSLRHPLGHFACGDLSAVLQA